MKKLFIVVTISLLALSGCASKNNFQPTSNSNNVNSVPILEVGSEVKSYKIGTDIAEREYYFLATGDPDPDYGNNKVAIIGFANAPVTSNTLNSDVSTLIFANGGYVTIDESDNYIYLVETDVYRANNKPIIKANSDGSYKPGMYKVGVDIPAGMYTLEAPHDNPETGFTVTFDSRFSTNEEEMLDNILASGPVSVGSPAHVGVLDGDYLNSGCKIIPE